MRITPDSPLYYLVVLLIFGNVFALIVGVLMLAAPQHLRALSAFSNRWISTRKATRPLARPRPSEPVMLHYPRVLGAILLASAAIILIKGMIFITSVGRIEGGRMLNHLFGAAGFSSATWEMLWIGMIVFIGVGALLALGVGLMSLFRLGQLKHWLTSVNRWVSTRQATKPLDAPHYPLDQLVTAQPRLWGGVITTAAIFSALVLWVFVLGA